MDLEGLSVGRPVQMRNGENVDFLLNLLPKALEREGYGIRNVWGTARVQRRYSRLPGTLQIALNQIFARHNGTMVWTKEIADEVLKKEIQERKSVGTLAQNVLLVASDSDFCSLVRQLVFANYFVMVTGYNVSKRFERVASKVISLNNLLGFEPKTKWEPEPVLLNSIEIPIGLFE